MPVFATNGMINASDSVCIMEFYTMAVKKTTTKNVFAKSLQHPSVEFASTPGNVLASLS